MPRFTGQNKKRTNPRYFLNETVEQQKVEEELEQQPTEEPLEEAMIYVSPRAAKEIAGMLGQAAAGHKALVEMISYMDRYLGATATDFIGPASKDIMKIGQLMSKIIKEYQTKVKAHKRIEDPQQSAESGVDALQKLAEMDLAKLAAMDDRQITRIDTLMDSGEFDKAMDAIHPIKLYKIAKPYLLADEDEEVANAAPEMRKEILVQLIKSMPSAEAEEVYDLVAGSLKARGTRRSSNKRFLDKMKSKFS